jgi:hypothetical protein
MYIKLCNILSCTVIHKISMQHPSYIIKCHGCSQVLRLTTYLFLCTEVHNTESRMYNLERYRTKTNTPKYTTQSNILDCVVYFVVFVFVLYLSRLYILDSVLCTSVCLSLFYISELYILDSVFLRLF